MNQYQTDLIIYDTIPKVIGKQKSKVEEETKKFKKIFNQRIKKETGFHIKETKSKEKEKRKVQSHGRNSLKGDINFKFRCRLSFYINRIFMLSFYIFLTALII